MSYGTGAIMAVPAHDERDWEFAKKFNLPIIQVVAKNGEEVDVNEAAFTDVATGVLINSDFINGLEVKEAKEKMIEFLTERELVMQRLIISFVTGCSLVRDTGASLFQLFIVTNVAMFQLMRANFHYCFQR